MKRKHVVPSNIALFCLYLLTFSVHLSAQHSIKEDPLIVNPGFSSRSDTVDEFIMSRIQDMNIPGLALAILKNGKVIKINTYGQSNIETGSLVSPESLFMIASLSKQFISMAVLILQQDGKLSVDDKITKYIDSLPDSWKNISIRQLLSHTSGIVRDPSDYQPYMEQPILNIIKSVYNIPLNADPGEKWLYSNIGYYILAEVITRVSGEPWDRFIGQRLFVPAGMTHTRISSAQDIIPDRVSGYHEASEGLINAERWIAVRPSSAFLSTIEDMAKWDEFLDHGNLLTESNRMLMWTQATLNDKAPVNYGLGWYVDSFLGRARVHHDGQFPGFRADYERFSDDNITVIVLANLDNYGLESIAIRIAGFFDPDLVTPTFSIIVNAPEKAASIGNPVPIEIKVRDQDRSAPGSLIEMEIWDEEGKSVYKQNKDNLNFDSGETKSIIFSWTPTKSGHYTVNVGTYGPHWTPSYTWKVNLATIIVNK